MKRKLSGMRVAPFKVVDADDPVFEGTDKWNAGTPAGTRLLSAGLNEDVEGAEFVTFMTADMLRICLERAAAARPVDQDVAL